MRQIAILLILLETILACDRTASAEPPATQPDPDMQAMVGGINSFALKLYHQLGTGNGNLIFSPYSVDTALMMVRAGAHGQTAQQMNSALGLDSIIVKHLEDFDAEAGNLMGVLRSSQNNQTYQLHIANALWSQNGLSPLPTFTKLLKNDYDSALHGVDFSDPVQASRTINDWVSAQTAGKITGLISPSLLPPGTQLALTNAIYFKGDWQSPFSIESTRNDDFHVAANTQPISIPTMHAQGRFAVMGNDQFEALELPYKGGNVAMLILLPRSPDGLSQLESTLNPKLLTDVVGGLREAEVDVSLPKFKLSQQLSLPAALKEMGIHDAFLPRDADFSGIDGTRDLFISDAVHKAYLAVDEKGTEAAAASGIIMMPTAVMAPLLTFRADHPFLFVIRDKRTGLLLFAGRLQDPRQVE